MFKKRLFVTVCVIAIVAMMAACSPAATEAPATEAPVVEEAVATTAPAAAIKVAVVAGGEIGDMGFIDSANGGLERMVNELGLETMIITNHDDNNNNLDILLSAAEEADLIFVIPGYFFDEQLKEVVPQFPDKTFVYVDGASSIEGMMSVSFKQNEGAFLAGALAALMTTQTEALANADDATVVGFMGGADMPVIHDYQVGFDQGAKYAVEGITLVDQYAGTHYDAAIGKETALAMYGQGADIIFQAAGPTGLGLFEAAKEAERYAIGVDTNQKGLAPEWVLASMRKNVGDSIFQFTQAFISGELEAGAALSYGLAENGVGIDYGGMDPDLVPQEIKDKVAEYAQKIIDGEIVVDTYTAAE